MLQAPILYIIAANYICIAWPDSLKRSSLGCTAVLSRRYKRKAIKRSFPSTTSDELRGVRLRLSFSRFGENNAVPLLDVLVRSGAGVVHTPKVL